MTSIQDLLDLPPEADHRDTVEVTQAERVINRFGGARELARLLNLNPTSVYRWTYPVSKGGTGGIVPTQALHKLLRMAREQGIYLTANDLYPGRG